MTTDFAPGIARIPVVFVNAYLVDVGGGGDGWVLVDTGLPVLGAREIDRLATQRYGAEHPPRAIVLTHGHFDHAGSALALARRWRVPVYAHRLELPFLTGRSDYPPSDPTVGGALAMMSRAFPSSGIDLGEHVHELPEDGSVPFLPEWRVVHTPGHTPGHVSLWRAADGTLLAGDALATMNQESWATTLMMPRELRWPPAPMTTDWDAAQASILELAALHPKAIAAGHGMPCTEIDPDAFDRFAATFTRPAYGRYVEHPAEADENGVTLVPPRVADPTGRALKIAAATAASAALVTAAVRHRQNRT